MDIGKQEVGFAALIAAASGLLAWMTLTSLVERPEPAPVEVDAPAAGHQGGVAIRLVDGEGAPLPCKATLWFEVEEGARRLDQSSSLDCDPRGWVVWEDLEPGTWRLMAAAEGYELFDQRVVLGPGERWTRDGQVLGPGGIIAGTVRYQGEPVLGASVRTTTGRAEVSQAGGAYRITGAPVGTQTVRAGIDSRGGGGEITVVAGELTTFDIDLEVTIKGLIGIQVEQQSDGVFVSAVHPRASAAGVLEVGDRIVAVDGFDVQHLKRPGVVELLSGQPDTQVTLGYRRGDAVAEATLARLPSDALK